MYTRAEKSRFIKEREVVERGASFSYFVGAWNPPTVADTKRKFYDGFRKPIPGVYNTVIQELLVQQHIMRYNKNYIYDEVIAFYRANRAVAPFTVSQNPKDGELSRLEFPSKYLTVLYPTGVCARVRERV